MNKTRNLPSFDFVLTCSFPLGVASTAQDSDAEFAIVLAAFFTVIQQKSDIVSALGKGSKR